MTVEKLIQLLQKEDPKAVVGAGNDFRTGWINSFSGIKHAEDGTVVLNMLEETTVSSNGPYKDCSKSCRFEGRLRAKFGLWIFHTRRA